MKPLAIAAGTAAIALVAGKTAAAAIRVPFDDIFSRFSQLYGVPKRLMVSIVAHESKFDPRAVNEETVADRKRGRDVDSLGLGQILFPDTASDYGITDREQLFDPVTNLEIVAKHLRARVRRYPVPAGDYPEDVVSAYNGGHSLRTNGGAFANQEYVDLVKIQWEKYANV